MTYAPVNIVIDLFFTLVGVFIWFANRSKEKNNITQKIFSMLLVISVCNLLFDAGTWILGEKNVFGARTLNLILCTLYFIFQILYCYLWVRYSDEWVEKSVLQVKKHRIIYATPAIFMILLVLINIPTGFVFSVSEENIYSRSGFGYYLYYAGTLFYVICTLIICVHSNIVTKEKKRKRQSGILALAAIFPIVATIVQGLSYGFSLIWPSAMISLLAIFMFIQQEQMNAAKISLLEKTIESKQLENQLLQNRVAVMLSQIQPHFLYNTLTAISVLCDKDPKLARKATIDFSDYLRSNMDSLTHKRPITFEKELEHTKNYLGLEKMRFDDMLMIEYDITATNFMIPSLTVQPIVENAVRYGVGKKKGGGTVRLATREYDDRFEVIISDDGVGFDVTAKKDDNRSHVGIENTKSRLQDMVGAELSLVSEVGVGTVATITLHKQF